MPRDRAPHDDVLRGIREYLEAVLPKLAGDPKFLDHFADDEPTLVFTVEGPGVSLTLVSSRGPPKTSLSPREKQVVALVGKGLGNKGIARHLSIQEETVKSHLKHIYQKLGVESRAALVRYAPVMLG